MGFSAVGLRNSQFWRGYVVVVVVVDNVVVVIVVGSVVAFEAVVIL
jgi:hypothetical protein